MVETFCSASNLSTALILSGKHLWCMTHSLCVTSENLKPHPHTHTHTFMIHPPSCSQVCVWASSQCTWPLPESAVASVRAGKRTILLLVHLLWWQPSFQVWPRPHLTCAQSTWKSGNTCAGPFTPFFCGYPRADTILTCHWLIKDVTCKQKIVYLYITDTDWLSVKVLFLATWCIEI